MRGLILAGALAVFLSGCSIVSGIVNPCHKGTPQQTSDCG